MRKLSLVGGLIVITTSSTAALAQEQPRTSFKDLYLGMSIEDVRGNRRFVCDKSSSEIADTVCAARRPGEETIAGAKTKGIYLFLIDDAVYSILIKIDPSDFSQIREAMELKYGSPKVEANRLTTRLGTSYDNFDLEWTLPDALIDLSKYGGKITEGIVRFRDRSKLREVEARRSTYQKERASDL